MLNDAHLVSTDLWERLMVVLNVRLEFEQQTPLMSTLALSTRLGGREPRNNPQALTRRSTNGVPFVVRYLCGDSRNSNSAVKPTMVQYRVFTGTLCLDSGDLKVGTI
jgi:hypothetical protein